MKKVDPSKWDAIGAEYAAWRALEYDPASYTEIYESVPESCRLAVDVGCGAGFLTAGLAAKAKVVVGLDVSFRMLLLARRHLDGLGVGNVLLTIGDGQRPPLRVAGVDFVLSVNTLHYTDLSESLPALGALLSPRGRLTARLLVVRHRRLSQWLAVRVLFSLKAVCAVILKHGPRRGLDQARLFLHPSWVRGTPGEKMTREDLAELCSRLLPGARVAAAGPGSVMLSWGPPPAP